MSMEFSLNLKFLRNVLAVAITAGASFWLMHSRSVSAQEASGGHAREEMAKRFAASMPDPMDASDHTGFTSIFDGNSLNGWDGDPTFWRAENGAIVGETTADKKLKVNTFLIWRGGKPKDFELKAEYRINNTNSGI